MHLLILIVLFVYNVEAILNLPEGSECFVSGHKGKCVAAKSCESFNLVDLVERTLRVSDICSHNNVDVVVCCFDCEPFTRDFRDSAATGDGYIWKNGRKSWDKCVEYMGKPEYNCINQRIRQNVKLYDKEKKCITTEMFQTGASYYHWLTNKENSPSHIAFMDYGVKNFPEDRSDVETSDTSFEVTESDVTESSTTELSSTEITGTEYCAGSIISERYILTAAQCGYNAENEPLTYAVVFNWQDNGKGHENSVWYEVKRFIPHPEYKSTVAAYHDIALIETKTEILFSYTTRPICLQDDPSLSEEYAKILSWTSENEDTGAKTNLYFDNVNRYNSARCSFRFSKEVTEGINSTLHSCYVDTTDESHCESVLGLPLEIAKPFFTCSRLLGGVAITNRTCGEADSIRLYTRVQPYIPWIEGIVWPDV